MYKACHGLRISVNEMTHVHQGATRVESVNSKLDLV
jgi:hypothetical protein